MSTVTESSLGALATARREAFQEADRIGVQLGRLLRDRHLSGVTLAELVSQTGYSRRQIYNLMEK